MTTSPTTSGKFSPPGLFLGGIKCLNPEKNKKNENLKNFYSFWFFLVLKALDHLPPLILASSPPLVCFWVVPMPKFWKNQKNREPQKFLLFMKVLKFWGLSMHDIPADPPLLLGHALYV